jgi:hypothetical protein
MAPEFWRRICRASSTVAFGRRLHSAARRGSALPWKQIARQSAPRAHARKEARFDPRGQGPFLREADRRGSLRAYVRRVLRVSRGAGRRPTTAEPVRASDGTDGA